MIQELSFHWHHYYLQVMRTTVPFIFSETLKNIPGRDLHHA